MNEVVLDASVMVKWIFPDRIREAHADRALDVLRAVQAGRLSVVEPPHWLAEVAAVITRLASDRAQELVSLMCALDFPVLEDLEVYVRAVLLSKDSRQHVFDTLYHAVALRRPDAALVTADERYYRRARHLGRVVLLEDFSVPAA